MKKYENFCKALQNLHEIYQYEVPYNTVTLTGLVGLYGICFEQSWKTMKEILYQNGVTAATGSPRSIIKEAYAAGMIHEEQLWLEAMQDRNNVAHAYNEDIANDIVRNAKEKYVQIFEDLKEEIKDNWS